MSKAINLLENGINSIYPPYAYVGNMPIKAVDVNGDSVARFGFFSGEFLGFFADGKAGWSFDIAYYNSKNEGAWDSKKHG